MDGLIEDFFMDIELVAVDTVREEDGLAKSSRNVYLTEQERKEAPMIYKALQQGAELIRDGERNPETVIKPSPISSKTQAASLIMPSCTLIRS